MHRLVALGLLVSLPALGCSESGGASPFVQDGGDGADAGPDRTTTDARATDGPIFGQPCLDDSQCDDGIACTVDSCNHDLRRCQYVLDDSRCQNGMYCDGVERCDPDLGCRQGSIQDCNDEMTCTIDRCAEATQMCDHKVRDADDDGSPDGHCQANGDCDDGDPTVNPGHVEVCGNAKDDNCDGKIDEMPCQKPTHDTCLDPLLVTKSGIYELDTTASSFDYPGSCAPMGATRKDVVAALQISGGPFDADIVAEAPGGTVAVGIGKDCGVLASEIACGSGTLGKGGNQIARVRARSLAMGAYPVYVWVDRDEKVLLHVTLAPPTPAPANETCGTAAPITIGTPVVASLVGTKKDLASRCGFDVGDLVYQFDLPDAADVTAYAASIDGYGVPIVSIRKQACAAPEDEIACGYGSPARTLARALPKGKYFVAVSANGPTDVQLEVTAASPPVMPPADDTCAGAPALVPNRTLGVSLTGHTDDIDLGCAPIASVDAAYALDLGTTSDVLLTLRIAQGDTGAVSLALPACAGAASNKLCGKGSSSPVRASLRGVPAGSYRAVVETVLGNPVEVTAFVRPAVPPTLVPFADTCGNATAIPETGGFFQGSTSNASADYSAGCDVTGVPPGGAPDQMMKFTLSQKKRVVFDMQGSGYATLLDVRRGETCPGLEMPGACSAGYLPLRSYLDLTLDPGTYWVQVDGYGSDQGIWFLDVRVVDP
jgi:hypothetical protein